MGLAAARGGAVLLRGHRLRQRGVAPLISYHPCRGGRGPLWVKGGCADHVTAVSGVTPAPEIRTDEDATRTCASFSARCAALNSALVRNVRTWPAMVREKAQAAPTVRPKYRCAGEGRTARSVEAAVMAVERRGRVIAVVMGQSVRREEPLCQRKAAAFGRHEPDKSRGLSPDL